jgi:hypothetical protein
MCLVNHLMQMREYRARASGSSMLESPVGDILLPVTTGDGSETRFTINAPEFNLHITTVESEIRDYLLSRSFEGCDLLRFWEVSDFVKISRLNSVMADILIG